MAASRNVTKYVVSHQYELYDGILEYNGIFPYNLLSALPHKFTNISTESIAGKKQILQTKQEPEGTYNIGLHGLSPINYQITGQIANSHFPNKWILWDIYNTKTNVREDLEFIIHPFSSHEVTE